MIAAGIDVGGTNTKAVLMKDGEIISRCRFNGNSDEIASECFFNLLKKAGMKIKDIDKIALTGGASRKIGKSVFVKGFVLADEIESLGLGGMHLSGKDSVFVASMGTGTAFVSVKNNKIEHLGGSGVGGGTLSGLSKLILDNSIDEAERTAMNGSRHNIDMTVNDIIGKDLCKIPKDATAANFGKLEGVYNNADIASGIINMVAEALGVMIYFASKTEGLENDILICGRVALNKIISKRVVQTISMFGGKSSIPEDAEYCGAIGAVLSL